MEIGFPRSQVGVMCLEVEALPLISSSFALWFKDFILGRKHLIIRKSHLHWLGLQRNIVVFVNVPGRQAEIEGYRCYM